MNSYLKAELIGGWGGVELGLGGVGGEKNPSTQKKKKIPDSQPENRYYIIIHKDRTFSL